MNLASRQQSKPSAKVLVVDDSAAVRAMLQSILAEIVDEQRIAVAVDGRHGLQLASRAALSADPFDIVLLDIEMPLMDGLQALDELVKLRPAPKVIMSSVLTRRGAAASMQALSRGASDYLCKPSSEQKNAIADFRRDLRQKIELWSTAKPKAESAAPPPAAAVTAKYTGKPKIADRYPPARAPVVALAPTDRPVTRPNTPPNKQGASVQTNPPERLARPSETIGQSVTKIRSAAIRPRCRALAIGSSTGGPQALLNILGQNRIPPKFPIFLTQHMPPTFTTILAEQIAKASGLPCREGQDGEVVSNGHIYLAPGTHHMQVVSSQGQVKLSLSDGPPVNFCRPAVDPMLESLAEVYDKGLTVLILTGMGQDGLSGSKAVKKRGGQIFAQDEASSVVWGMPGAIVKNNLQENVLNLEQIKTMINSL